MRGWEDADKDPANDHRDPAQRFTRRRVGFEGVPPECLAAGIAGHIAINVARATSLFRRSRAFWSWSETSCCDARVRSRSWAPAVYMHDVLGHELNEIALMLGITAAAAQSH